jgi:hypothetical protein
MRRLWVCGLILLVGCVGTPNAQATQTRTSEIATNTALTGVLPTQNPAVHPAPIPTPNGVATLTVVVGATRSVPISTTARLPTINVAAVASGVSAGYGSDIQPAYGSWVAFYPLIHVRFFAPPSLVEDPEHNSPNRFALSSPSNVFDFEALDIYRFPGARGGDYASTWQSEMNTFRKGNNITSLVVTSAPQQQQVGAYQGNIGQFHYYQRDNGLQISGTTWVGQVGGDEAVIIYRCSPDREGVLDGEFGQVIATIDFGATDSFGYGG